MEAILVLKNNCNKENLTRMTNYSSSPDVTSKNNLKLNLLFVKIHVFLIKKADHSYASETGDSYKKDYPLKSFHH